MKKSLYYLLILLTVVAVALFNASCGSNEKDNPGGNADADSGDVNTDAGENGDSDSSDGSVDDTTNGDDDTAAGDDDTAAGDDDTAAGDDDTAAGDDDITVGDDDTTDGDDDTAAGDDDTVGGDDDITGGDGSSENPDVEEEKVVLKFIEKGTNESISKKNFTLGYVLTDEDVEDIRSIAYHGYKYKRWLTSAGVEISAGIKLEQDTEFYAERGDLAGENITWEFVTGGDDSKLVLTGSGPMFDFEFNDDAPWIALAPFISEIVFDGDITTVGNCSFYGFSALGKLVLPEGITKVGEKAFYNSSVTDIVFPDSLKTVEGNAFFRCLNLTELNFNVGLEYIGKGAFYECANVVNVILTDKIAELGNSAFYGNYNLQTAYYYGTKEQYDSMLVRLDNFWVKELANTYFISGEQPEAPGPYWHYNENGNVEQWYYTVGFFTATGKVPFVFDYVDPQKGISQENIDFIDSIVYHGYKFEKWFYNGQPNSFVDFAVGDKLDGDIRLRGYRGNLCGDNVTYQWRNGVITISGTGRMWDFEEEGDAPWEKRTVSKIVIEDGIEYIGSYAFCDKTALTYIDIPIGVREINVNAFSGCINLQYVYYMGSAEQMKSVVGLDSLNNIERANVYCKTEETASSSEGYFWKYLTGLVTEGEKRVAWGINDGKLTVGGDASLVNYISFTDTPWYASRDSITAVEILPGANRVGSHSFENMTGVTSVVIPDSVLKISESAFLNTGVYNNSESYTDGALYISNHLIKVIPEQVGETFIIKDGVISIAENAFAGCSSIKNLVFSKDIFGVYRGALSGLNSLEKIYSLHTAAVAWENIWMSGNDLPSQNIGSAEVLLFSKFAPTDEESSYRYWRYVTDDGVTSIEIW